MGQNEVLGSKPGRVTFKEWYNDKEVRQHLTVAAITAILAIVALFILVLVAGLNSEIERSYRDTVIIVVTTTTFIGGLFYSLILVVSAAFSDVLDRKTEEWVENVVKPYIKGLSRTRVDQVIKCEDIGFQDVLDVTFIYKGNLYTERALLILTDDKSHEPYVTFNLIPEVFKSDIDRDFLNVEVNISDFKDLRMLIKSC